MTNVLLPGPVGKINNCQVWPSCISVYTNQTQFQGRVKGSIDTIRPAVRVGKLRHEGARTRQGKRP